MLVKARIIETHLEGIEVLRVPKGTILLVELDSLQWLIWSNMEHQISKPVQVYFELLSGDFVPKQLVKLEA
jgi:hypothetical protein